MVSKKTKERRKQYAKEISKHTKKNWILYYLDETYCHYAHGASPENYFVLRFFSLNEEERKEYLTSKRSREVDAFLNRNSSKKDRNMIGNKRVFNQQFSEWNHRKYLYAPDCTQKEILNFLEEQGVVFVKPTGLTQGRGMQKVYCSQITSPDDFAEESRKKNYLLEEIIRQHPVIEQIHKESVNTVRILAARANPESPIVLIGGALRCGCGSAVVDNFHQGGIAYPIDLKQGVICGPGRDNTTLKEYSVHPGSQIMMPGLAVPFWEQALEAVRYGMEKVPSLGYVGWDLAVTETGIEVIEGNYNWPGGNIIQVDGKGKYPLAKSVGAGRETV
ncbi:MAG: sugar-transfer associated ATP-grasp domain-containing protein [Hespellia sp.]|nr:sugar-transfer associated ATP-grasp domain-containing protein [Hespellia sp.]